MMVPLCWTICGLANWNDSTSSLKDIWRRALFSQVIVCGSVLIFGIFSIILLPEFSSAKIQQDDAINKKALLEAAKISWGQNSDLEISSESSKAMTLRQAVAVRLAERKELLDQAHIETFLRKPGNFSDLSTLSDAVGALLVTPFFSQSASNSPKFPDVVSRAASALDAAAVDSESLRLEVLEFSKSIVKAREQGVTSEGSAFLSSGCALLEFLRLWIKHCGDAGNFLKESLSRDSLL
jgi:hypothetical protein